MTDALIIRADWLLADATQRVFAALERGGYEARAVGGIVRNALLNLPSTDIDIATTARPQDTIRLANAAGLKTIETGLAHGTVTVVSGGVPFEVTTLRRDVTTDGRHADVAFTDDWVADAARRDFTINALYCGRDGRVFDPLGGLADLNPVRVRFIGAAEARICEDYLRILRFFRFTAGYSPKGSLDEAGLAACLAHAKGLARISGERIGTELFKLLVAPHSVAVTRVFAMSGIYHVLFGMTPRTLAFERLAAIEARLAREGDGVLRLAALGVALQGDAERLDARMRLSARDRKRLFDSVALRAMVRATTTEDEARRLLYRHGVVAYSDAVMLAWADSAFSASDPRFEQLARLPERWSAPKFPITGADVVALGVAPGVAIGVHLAGLENDWIGGGFAEDRPQLLARLAHRVGGLSA